MRNKSLNDIERTSHSTTSILLAYLSKGNQFFEKYFSSTGTVKARTVFKVLFFLTQLNKPVTVSQLATLTGNIDASVKKALRYALDCELKVILSTV